MGQVPGNDRREEAESSDAWQEELATEHIPETEEYGISNFVFRAPFHPKRLTDFWEDEQPGVVRAKRFFRIATHPELTFLFSQAGTRKRVDRDAIEAGARVVLLEKMPVVGGNSMRATGGINAAGTSVQAALGITDTPDLFYEDAFRGGREMNYPALLRIRSDQSAGAVEWLIGYGADLSDVVRLGGHSVNRSHRPTGGAPVGATVVTTLQGVATERNVDIRLWNEVTDLIIEEGRVVGVDVTIRDGSTEQLRAGAVIIAAGGFGADNDMVARYDAELRGFGTTNHPGADGAIIELVSATSGVSLIHMEQIQAHPTVVPADGTMVTEAVRGNGAILVSRTGRRFANELGTRDVVSDATLAQPEGTAFLLFDHSVRESLRSIENYIRQGIVIQGDSVEALAGEIGIDATVLAQTVVTYNQAVASGTDAEFGRSDMPRTLSEGTFYAIEVGPGVHHTMGGIRISSNTQVLNESGAPIPGLYAAGEVTGGIHGANRLGGNARGELSRGNVIVLLRARS